jgi:NAD(P)H-hydrate repair Nnr-like enzyme with NAD(P)H-hydrate dehydratase domain
MEFDRLSEAVRNQLRNHEVASPTIETILQELSVENEAVKTRALSLALGGVTVYRKGEVDLITSGNDVYAITERGSPRRCGGQGDILAGTLATAYYWAFKVS